MHPKCVELLDFFFGKSSDESIGSNYKELGIRLREIEFNPEIYYPVIWSLMRYTFLNEVKECLDAIDPKYHDETYFLITDRYNMLNHAQHWDCCAWPLTVSWRERWNGPHLNFPKEYNGYPIKEWFPAVIEGTSDSVAFLAVAMQEKDKDIYGNINILIDELQENCNTKIEKQDEGDSQQFLELVYYEDESLIVRKYQEDDFKLSEELRNLDEQIKPWVVFLIQELLEFEKEFFFKREDDDDDDRS